MAHATDDQWARDDLVEARNFASIVDETAPHGAAGQTHQLEFCRSGQCAADLERAVALEVRQRVVQ